jgi:hypothetical protein
MRRTVTDKYAYRAQHAACHVSRASVSRRIGLAVAADPAQRPSMEEVRDALHELYSAEVRRSRKGRDVLYGLAISESIAQVQREHFGA